MQDEMDIDYNDRLFNNKQIRGKLHLSRYFWLEKQVAKYCPTTNSVLELGCFDGKAIDFLPKTDYYYEGYDANWENGLEIGKKKLIGSKNHQLFFCDTVKIFTPTLEKFDISICMETLEHLPLQELEQYLQKLALHTKHYCFVSVPNEKGIVLLIKYLTKKLVFKNIPEPYTTKELFYGVTGSINKVARNEGGHKGFDYKQLLTLLEKYFTITSIEGLPFKYLAKSLSFTIGIVLKPKQQ